jgi:hypothetical protein
MHSMGKAIDALFTASVQIEQDGELYLDENFMNDNVVPLPPQEAIQYQYEVKQTPA